MKSLSGLELVGYIKERQAKQVRNLRQAARIFPKLAVVQTIDSPVIDTYVRLKKTYGEDILIDVEHHKVLQADALRTIHDLNDDTSVHGIIIQLPLPDMSGVEALVNAVAPAKDVDGLGADAYMDPATAMAIDWLMMGYNVDLTNKKIVIVGQGRLVGEPLAKLWRKSGYEVTTVDESTEDVPKIVRSADVVVTATGSPGIITSDMLQLGAVVVDAATASEGGKIVGDVADEVYSRQDLTITPKKGGVGPLTVAALFDNVIRAARESTVGVTHP